MAWADLADAAASTNVTLRLFVSLNVYNRDTDSTTTLYVSDGQFSTDAVDGTWREWDGRISGSWTINKPDQRIGTSQWATPSCSFSLWVGDSSDSYADYLGPEYQWERQSASVYLAAWSDGELLGVQKQISGVIDRGPSAMKFNSDHRISVVWALYKTQVNAPPITMPSRLSASFVQPVIRSYSDTAFDGAHVAGDTVFKLQNITDLTAGVIALVHDTGELVRVSSVDAGLLEVTVQRGYNGTTTAPAIANNDLFYAMWGGQNKRTFKGTNGVRVPVVVNAGLQDKGALFDVTPYAAGASTRLYAGGVANAYAEVWYSVGVGPKVTNRFLANMGDPVLITSEGSTTSHNDWTAPAGTVIAAGDAIPAGTYNYHIMPHPVPVGSYFVAETQCGGWSQFDFEQFARIRGVTADNTTTGNQHRYPNGIMEYMLTDVYGGLGLTLTDWVVSGVLDGWNAGTWRDEFTVAGDEAWWSQIAGCVPEMGSSDAPYIMDVLQELADISDSDVWVSGGKLFPKRRTVGATADVTVDQTDLTSDAQIMEHRDYQGLFCTRIIALYEQPIYAEPENATDQPPIDTPYSINLWDQKLEDSMSITPIEIEIRRQWWRYNLSETWTQEDVSLLTPSTEHMAYWERSHQLLLDHCSQRQSWMEATLSPRLAYLEQGDTIAYDVSPFTSRLGQVRDIKITGGAAGASVTVRSWHIEF